MAIGNLDSGLSVTWSLSEDPDNPELYTSQTSVTKGEWHPVQSKIRFIKMLGQAGGGSVMLSSDFLDAHYNPKEINESISVNYATKAVGGIRQQRMQFMYGHPRQWTMVILLNDWGRDPSSQPEAPKSCDAAIDWLRGVTLPGLPGSSLTQIRGAATQTGLAASLVMSRRGSSVIPPVVLVVMGSKSFAVHITSLNIKHMKVGPVDGRTVRALVSLTMKQWIPAGTK